MGWYKDRLNEHMDVNQAIRDRGLQAQAIATLAGAMKSYGDQKYTKKLTERKFADKAADRANKVRVANIKAAASDRRNAASIKVAGINFDRERYKSDKAYRKAVDTEMLRNRGKAITANAKIASSKISAGAKVKAAGIGAGARIKAATIGANSRKYVADRGYDREKLSSNTKLKTSRLSSATQLRVAKTNAEAKKAAATARAQRAATKKAAASLDLSGSDEDILLRLKKSRKSSDIGDMEIK